MIDFFFFLENNSSVMNFIVSSNGSFVKRETTSKLTNLYPDKNFYKCSLLMKLPVDLNKYLCGMQGFIILSKNFANLYAGVLL